MRKSFFQAALATATLSGLALAGEHAGNGGSSSGRSGTGATQMSNTGTGNVVHQNVTPSNGNKSPVANPVSANHTPNLQASYVKEHGKAFGNGIFYPGRNQSHWTYRCWSHRYGCECYWCPYTCSYYFWYEPSSCYYPVSYYTTCYPQPVVQVVAPVKVYASVPVQTQIQTQVQTQTQTQSQTAIAGPPPGVPAQP